MEFLTIVNRTSKTLEGTWDGRHYELAPGKHSFPQIQAEKFKDQNPLMGSEDPVTGEVTYLIGIEDYGDDCSPIEQAPAIERWNRAKLPESARNVDVVPGKTGIFSGRDVQASALPKDSAFVKAD